MNTTKLKEALVELQQQRAILDGAISNIQRIIATMNGGSEAALTSDPHVSRSSYIDDGVRILEIAGQPLHIDEITKKVSEMRREEIDRPSVESSFSRHISKTKNSRVVRVRPGYYGLPAWKTIIHEPQSGNAA